MLNVAAIGVTQELGPAYPVNIEISGWMQNDEVGDETDSTLGERSADKVSVTWTNKDSSMPPV